VKSSVAFVVRNGKKAQPKVYAQAQEMSGWLQMRGIPAVGLNKKLGVFFRVTDSPGVVGGDLGTLEQTSWYT
jgi:hypothetical protein